MPDSFRARPEGVPDDQLRCVRETAVAVEEPDAKHATDNVAGCARNVAAVHLVWRSLSQPLVRPLLIEPACVSAEAGFESGLRAVQE